MRVAAAARCVVYFAYRSGKACLAIAILLLRTQWLQKAAPDHLAVAMSQASRAATRSPSSHSFTR